MEATKSSNGERKTLKDQVSAEVRKERAEYKKSGAWREKDIPFNHGLILSEDNNTLVEQLLDELLKDKKGYKREQKLIDLKILLANLNQKRKSVSVPLAVNMWYSSMYRRASLSTIELIKKLEIGGYIEMAKGYYFEDNSRWTRIWATDKLFDYLMPLPQSVIWKPVQVVELKTHKGKMTQPRSKRVKPKKIYELTEFSFEENPKVWQIRSILEHVNEINTRADIMLLNYGKQTKLNVSLVAIFIENFNMYGRLHARGYFNYQSLSEVERGKITINGDPIVELDYSGLHPNLLYAKEGRQLKNDPYSVVDVRRKVRPFLKHILLCMLNSEDEDWAQKGANSWLFDNKREEGELETLHKLGIFRAKPLMDAFRIAHKPIAKYLCQGSKTGMKIMNKESRIALDVLNHFVKKEIPILAIHDSFIVQKQYRNELYDVMLQTYSKHTHGFCIKVKDKKSPFYVL